MFFKRNVFLKLGYSKASLKLKRVLELHPTPVIYVFYFMI